VLEHESRGKFLFRTPAVLAGHRGARRSNGVDQASQELLQVRVLEEIHQVGDDLDFPRLGKKGNCCLVGRCRMVPLPLGGEATGSLGTGRDGSSIEKRLSSLLVVGILELPGVEDVLLGELPLAQDTVFDFLEEGLVQHAGVRTGASDFTCS